ncbi:MAG: AAA family ATPase [Verrucomicrobia bacterium]|nr:AAA family ATPase [Verrucomicrobiota bacterium]
MKTRPIRFREISLKNFLSFGPAAAPIPLTNLNLIIGPNGSGKSNLIEAFELLRAAPTDLVVPLREGGGAQEWLWKGRPKPKEAVIDGKFSSQPELRYKLAFSPIDQGFEVTDEVLENAAPGKPGKEGVFFYYRFQEGRPVINTTPIVPSDNPSGQTETSFKRTLKREEVKTNQSIFSQRKDPEIYPEVTAVGQYFGNIQTFREWQFGRSAALRRPQPADQPTEDLLHNLNNLGLVLNDLEHRDGIWPRLHDYCRRFLPRFSHLTTRVQAGTIQIYLHEKGLSGPTPATRLSDGTIRFLSLLAILLGADRHPLICIEEPELGIHPDAIALLAELLVETADVSQLVVTTHSDVLVSALTDHAESVLVCEHASEAGTTLTRLESAKLAFWLDKYRLGEVWRIGEIGGNL